MIIYMIYCKNFEMMNWWTLNTQLWFMDEVQKAWKSCAFSMFRIRNSMQNLELWSSQDCGGSSSQLASLSTDVASDSGSTWNRPLCRLANSRWSQSHCREAVFHHQSLSGNRRFESKKRPSSREATGTNYARWQDVSTDNRFLVDEGRVIVTMCLRWPLLSACHM